MTANFEDMKMIGLRHGGHLCDSQSRIITLCELGISPIWCPKPKKYTFTEKCKECYLYNAEEITSVDYEKIHKIGV